jgi:exosome complex component MTR3
MTTDRRRINGPSGGTSAPIFSQYLSPDPASKTERPTRTRKPNVLRKMCMYYDFEIIYEY